MLERRLNGVVEALIEACDQIVSAADLSPEGFEHPRADAKTLLQVVSGFERLAVRLTRLSDEVGESMRNFLGLFNHGLKRGDSLFERLMLMMMG